MKKKWVLLVLALVALSGSLALADDHEGTWTGEVIDLACYVSQGARGADHADCAKTCVKSGQPMGLLTDDGTLVLLSADYKDEAPYEELKNLAGERAQVTGELTERDGMKVVKVIGAKAA